MTPCNIEVFDCTCDGKIPSSISNRTKYHKKCISPSIQKNSHGWDFITYQQAINERAIRTGKPARAPEYFKIDVEGKNLNI